MEDDSYFHEFFGKFILTELADKLDIEHDLLLYWLENDIRDLYFVCEKEKIKPPQGG
jgi:hypothetical protein